MSDIQTVIAQQATVSAARRIAEMDIEHALGLFESARSHLNEAEKVLRNAGLEEDAMTLHELLLLGDRDALRKFVTGLKE